MCFCTKYEYNTHLHQNLFNGTRILKNTDAMFSLFFPALRYWPVHLTCMYTIPESVNKGLSAGTTHIGVSNAQPGEHICHWFVNWIGYANMEGISQKPLVHRFWNSWRKDLIYTTPLLYNFLQFFLRYRKPALIWCPKYLKRAACVQIPFSRTKFNAL